MRTPIALALLMLAGSAWAASADEEDLAMAYGDTATLRLATGSTQTLREAPAVATVITAEEIAAMGATDLDEVLETVPGLHVSRSANSYAPLYVIRGVYTQFTPQVLMLQNGIPITTLYIGNKGNIWGGYPVEHIARIEIIRGPGSALHGADAYSGVINIITKSAQDVAGTHFGLRAGTQASRSAWVQHGGQWGPVDVAAFLRVGGSDGIQETVRADAQTRFDRLLGTRASLAPGHINNGNEAIDGNLELGAGQWRTHLGVKIRDHVGSGAGIASALDPIGYARSERYNADVSWTDTQFAPFWEVGALASFMSYAQIVPSPYQLFAPGANIGAGISGAGFLGAPETWERQIRLSAYAEYNGFIGHKLRIGVGHDDLDLYQTRERRNFYYTAAGALVPLPGGELRDFSNSQPFLFPQRRVIDYVLAQDEWKLAKDWTLTAGIRHDAYSDVGSTTNPRLALVWDASLEVTAKLLAGRAFRAPAFNEIYGITNPVAVGNARVRPELVSTVEAAFTWQPRRDVQVYLSLFKYDMSDIIRNIGGTYQNNGEQTGRGVEVEARWDVGRKLRLSANYALQKSLDVATQKDTGYAPNRHFYTRADWNLSGDWLCSTQLNWIGERKRPVGDLRDPVADYTTLDLSIGNVAKAREWSFRFGIRNALDADVREPSVAPGTSLPDDLPMARRTAFVQLEYRL